MIALLNRYPSLALVAFAVLLVGPVFALGAGGTDLHVQSLWVNAFNTQFYGGEWYPRWLMDLFAGSGSPVFFYYPPLAFFTSLPFRFLAPLDAFGYYPIAASVLVAVALSGITCHRWLTREGVTGRAALVGSLVYMAAPAHVAEDFYHTLLFGSVWVYVWLPLWLLAAGRVANRAPYGVPAFALVLGLMVLTNIPCTIIFGPLMAAYVLYRAARWAVFLRLAVATLLGFALAGIFLLPCLVYMPYALVDAHWSVLKGDTYAASRFFFGFASAESQAYVAYWVLCALLTGLAFWQLRTIAQGRFFIAVSAIALCMMLPLSAVMWDHVPLVKVIQVAERFFAVLVLAQAWFVAAWWPRGRRMVLGLLALYVVLTLAVAVNSRTTMADFEREEPARFESYRMNIDQYATYLTSPDLIARYGTTEGRAMVGAQPEQLAVTKGRATARVIKWRPRHMLLETEGHGSVQLRVRQFAFPGWVATDGDGQALATSRDATTGHLLVEVPAGTHVVTLTLTPLLPETAGAALSLLALAVLLLMGLVTFQRARQL